jgi:hypothetical protein
MSILRNQFVHYKGFVILSLITIVLSIIYSSCKKEDLKTIDFPAQSFEIKELEIKSNNLAKSREFWSESLNLPVIDSAQNEFTVQLGNSRLKFSFTASGGFIVNHFSILIPNNQIENALDWLKNPDGKYINGPSSPVKIIKDEKTGAEIISNPIQNARSIYFEDPTGNIVELVARKDFGTEVMGEFSSDQFLKIVEVAAVSKSISKCYDILKSEFNVVEFPGSTSGYKPVGGGDGSILLINFDKPWKPTESSLAIPYQTTVTIRSSEEKTIALPNMVFYSTFTIKTEP